MTGDVEGEEETGEGAAFMVTKHATCHAPSFEVNVTVWVTQLFIINSPTSGS